MKRVKTSVITTIFSFLFFSSTAVAHTYKFQGKGVSPIDSLGEKCFYAIKEDADDRLSLCLKAAENGSLFAQEMIPVILTSGNFNVEQNSKEALKWARKAADRGSALGQTYVGLFYLFGFGGVKEDSKKAKAWLTKGCNGGALDACEILKKENFN